MKRIALDTNVINRIADSSSRLLEDICAAARMGRIIIIGIPTVRNELEQTSCLDRRALLVKVYEQLPVEAVLDQAGYWGVSRWGQGVYGDGSHTGVSVEKVRTDRFIAGARDGIIAVTASGKADVLVTEDRSLKEKVLQSTARCEVWTLNEFISWLGEPTRCQLDDCQ